MFKRLFLVLFLFCSIVIASVPTQAFAADVNLFDFPDNTTALEAAMKRAKRDAKAVAAAEVAEDKDAPVQNGAPVGDTDSDANSSDDGSSVDGTQTQTEDQSQNQSSSQNQNVNQNENQVQNQSSSAAGDAVTGISQSGQATSEQVSTGSGTNSGYTTSDITVPLYNDGRSVTYSGNTDEGVVTQTANSQVQPKLADTSVIALVVPATVLGVGAGVAFVVRATKERKVK